MDETDRTTEGSEPRGSRRPGAAIWIVALLGLLLIASVLFFAFRGDGGIASEPKEPRIDLPGGEPVEGAGANG